MIRQTTEVCGDSSVAFARVYKFIQVGNQNPVGVEFVNMPIVMHELLVLLLHLRHRLSNVARVEKY
jgi:hypothetical protein